MALTITIKITATAASVDIKRMRSFSTRDQYRRTFRAIYVMVTGRENAILALITTTAMWYRIWAIFFLIVTSVLEKACY